VLEDLWRELDIVEITPTLAQSAVDLAEHLGLRGHDAVHLAAGLSIRADVIVTADDDLLRSAPKYRLGLIDTRS